MRFPLLLVLLSAAAVHMKNCPETWEEICKPGMEDIDTPEQDSDWCAIARLGSLDDVSWCNEEYFKGNCCGSCYKAERERLRRKAARDHCRDEASNCTPGSCRNLCYKPLCAKTCNYCEDAEKAKKAYADDCKYDQWFKQN